ncbi:sulfite exporter TauE/SafE family protein [Vibrio sp.]|uniref:sulfite exporter TauE/SafE family protein n=1 Tax=Vibrio sp. TaxID=678 RepID=UPI003D1393FE
MLTALILGLIAFTTSLVAGVIGFGGGLLLIAIMPQFLSGAAIIPIHSVTQLSSNASRALFAIKDVHWPFVVPFLLGSVIGIVLFGFLLSQLPTDYLPMVIGSYILLNLWSNSFARALKKYESLYIIGLLQTGLGLVVGATGPLGMSALGKKLADSNQVIATAALFMSISHVAKLAAFGLIGFSFADYSAVIFAMLTGSIVGSLVGTKLRHRMNGDRLIGVIKLLLTLLAIRMIYQVWAG